MKPYLVFAGMNDTPSGGWGDFVGSADTMDEALAIVQPDAVWWHVVHEEHVVEHEPRREPKDHIILGEDA